MGAPAIIELTKPAAPMPDPAPTTTILRWRVPVTESTRFQSRVCLIQIQLISQATGVWVHLQAAAYSTGVR